MTKGVLVPLKDAMATSASATATRKFAEIIRCLVLGINGNKSFAPEDSITWATTLVKENIILAQQGKIKATGVKGTQESIYLLVKETRRDKGPEACFNTNAHLLVEMGLSLVLTLFKHGKIRKSDQGMLTKADNMIPSLMDGLHSKYNKIIILSMKVISFILPLSGGGGGGDGDGGVQEDDVTGSIADTKIGPNANGTTIGDDVTHISRTPQAKECTAHVTSRVFKLIRRSGASQV